MNKIISPRRAIALHCKGCIYDPLAGGTWREQVEHCAITGCELYQHRPLTAKTRQSEREKALASLPPDEREFSAKYSREASKKTPIEHVLH